uniref:Uncharacterized protein n=1 Tax=Ciona savignyi TaxID=51511 RepID=H2ZFE7_CIOSA
MQLRSSRSPRHAIMLTRRHSFYRDDVGGKSRTVARAEVVQQHHEAAPPTPSAARSKQLSDAGSKTPFSPGSLLFKYTGPGQRNIGRKYATENPQRTRRRLNLVSTPLSDTFKPVAKNLFSSNPEDQNTEISLATSAPQPSVKAPQKSIDFDGKAPQPTTPPGIPTPFAAYQDSDGLTDVFVSPDKLSTHATHKSPNQQKGSHNFTTPQKPDPNFTTPQKSHISFATPQKPHPSLTPRKKQPVTLATPKKRRDTIPAAQRP